MNLLSNDARPEAAFRGYHILVRPQLKSFVLMAHLRRREDSLKFSLVNWGSPHGLPQFIYDSPCARSCELPLGNRTLALSSLLHGAYATASFSSPTSEAQLPVCAVGSGSLFVQPPPIAELETEVMVKVHDAES